MASHRQIESNRRNAQHSRGPKTQAGKRAAAANAIKHGLLSEVGLLPEESCAEYSQFCKQFYSELEPAGQIECELVERIVSLSWRLRRFARLEAGILLHGRGQILDFKLEDGKPITQDQALSIVSGREYIAFYGGAFVQVEDALGKYSRYETTLQNNLCKTLHELQRLRALRRGESVPAPAVFDVNLNA